MSGKIHNLSTIIINWSAKKREHEEIHSKKKKKQLILKFPAYVPNYSYSEQSRLCLQLNDKNLFASSLFLKPDSEREPVFCILLGTAASFSSFS